MRYAMLGACVLLACVPPPTTEECFEPDGGATSFIALECNFQGYESWELSHFDGGFVDEAHPAGQRWVYLNHRPPDGSTEWPVGTIFVKVLDFTTFASVKRGGGFNSQDGGAPGWEWFELTSDANNTTRIKWRGVGPPIGENYSATGETCNACHSSGDNDHVLTPAYRL